MLCFFKLQIQVLITMILRNVRQIKKFLLGRGSVAINKASCGPSLATRDQAIFGKMPCVFTYSFTKPLFVL